MTFVYHSHNILFEDGPVVYPATRLTLVGEVIRYRLVQVQQNLDKTFWVGGP